MSGLGENTSDPSRAESRKRKDPDQLGPRLDHLYLKTLKEKDLKKKKKKVTRALTFQLENDKLAILAKRSQYQTTLMQ